MKVYYRLMLVFLVMSCWEAAHGQELSVSGVVRDDSSQPLPGANVLLKGTSTGTTTDSDGKYTLLVSGSNPVLVFSFIGYASKEVTVGNNSSIDVSLSPDVSLLNEVVVTGYTSEQRKDITGSVSVVKASDLTSIPASSVEQQLQGRASGVTVISNGMPGSANIVRIRGFASYGSNAPLYVIDGVPTLDVSALNPNDVESLNVLKDAGAASVYGSRASNGVIVITTKKGKAGVPKLTYDVYYGFTDPGKGLTNLLNSQEMADLTWAALRNSGQVGPNGNPSSAQYGNGPNPILPDYVVPSGQFETLPDGSPNPAVDPSLYKLDIDNQQVYQIVRANKKGTDWFDELTDNAPIQNHNLGLSGGNDHGRYFLGLNYFNQQGIVLSTYLKRYSIRANTEFTIKDKIRVGENLQMTYRENLGITNLYEANPIAQTFRIQPIIPVHDIMGNWAGTRAPETGNGDNPVAVQSRQKDNSDANIRLTGNVYAEVDLLKNFTLRTSFGGNFQDNYAYWFGYPAYETSQPGFTNSYNESASRYADWTWSNTVTFNRDFGEHKVKFVGGMEAIKLDISRGLNGARTSYFLTSPDFWTLSDGSSGVTNGSYHSTPTTLYSQFGRADYAYREKYLISATVRRDASSRFSPANKFGVFPSFTAAWRISGEPFMAAAQWVSDLKIRAGYGTMGSQLAVDPGNQYFSFSSSPSQSYYDIAGQSTSAVQGFRPSRIGNPEAKWETNITTNVGLDASLLDGQFDLSIDLYKKDTKDLLYNVQLPGIAGAASTPAINVGAMDNKGLEVLATYRKTIARDLKLETTLTFNTYRNEIVKLADGIDYFTAGGTRTGDFIRNMKGQPLSTFYGYKVVGIFQTQEEVDAAPAQQDAKPGVFRYQDVDKNNKIDDNDRTILGNAIPDYTYGLNISASYKNFDLAVFLYGVQGRELVNYTLWWTDFYSSFAGAKSKDLLYGSWKSLEDRGNGRTPAITYESSFSTNGAPNSYYIQDGSYLRVRNVTIGYTVPGSLLNKIGIDRLRIYAQGTNLFTATKYTGLDPELGGSDVDSGIDRGNYPTTRQFLLGLNLGF